MSLGVERSVLERYPAEYRPTGTVQALGNSGGGSGSRLWRFPAHRGMLVLRAWPADGLHRSEIERIHAWVRTAAAKLPYVPSPLAASNGSTLIEAAGRLWDLCPWMPGAADGARPPSDSHIRTTFDSLARFHLCFPSKMRTSSPGIASRIADLDRWIGGDFAQVGRRFQPVGADLRSDLARAWVDHATRMAPGIRRLLGSVAEVRVLIQPCLRDARPDHWLFEGDKLTGLIDFGAMSEDTVAGDLARLGSEALGGHRAAWQTALASYQAVRPLSGDEVRLISVFEAANAVLGAGRWVRWHFGEGRRFDDPNAVVTGLRRGLERIDELQRSATSFGGGFRT